MVVIRAKVAVVGDGTVGKTALVQMAFSGGVTFPKNYMMTIGVDLCVKEIPVDQHTTVELHLYDVGGQDVYAKKAADYLADIDAFVAVYDISNKNTFDGLNKWVEKCRATTKATPGFLVANKMDLKDKAEVLEGQGEILARKANVPFYQCSALRGVGVMDPLVQLAKDVAQRYEDRARYLHTVKQ
jgi:transport family protein 27